MTRPDRSPNRRILLIDDNESIHEDFRKIFGGRSADDALDALQQAVLGDDGRSVQPQYELDTASQGQDGLAHVRRAVEEERPYAVAFVDLRMPPGWDGVETIGHLWEADPRIEIVICTAYSDYSLDEIQGRLEQTERFVILKKPFDPIEVRQLARALSEKWNDARRADMTMNELNETVEDRTRVLCETNESLMLLNKELKDNQRQLVQSEKMASVGLLASGIAHEINNPNGFVMSNLNTLQDYIKVFKELFEMNQRLYAAIRQGDDTTARTILNEIEAVQKKEDCAFIFKDVDGLLSESCEGTERVRDIVQSLKTFARQDDSECSRADLNECIESTLKIIWNELKYKCEVRRHFGTLPLLLCYPQQLNQVFMNMLVNASHSIERHGTIDITTEATATEIRVRIADSGSGIETEHVARIFDPFFTTKPIGKGTGLGLSISHGIVEKHKGRIEVESEPGVGTTFTVILPFDGVTPPDPELRSILE